MRFLPVALTLLLAACATTPRIATDFDPSANFASYRTYQWLPSDPPEGMNPLLFERIRRSVDRSLTTRGYAQAATGEFAIQLGVTTRDRVEVREYGPWGGYPGWGWGGGWGYGGWGWGRPGWGYGGWGPSIDIDTVTDGRLTIDIYDSATKRPVWHGSATQRVQPDRVKQEAVDAMVDALLIRFPPQH